MTDTTSAGDVGIEVDDDLVDRVRRHRWSPSTLRLSPVREPFADVPEDVLRGFVAEVLSTPERDGHMSDAVRHVARVDVPDHTGTVTAESHIDVTVARPELKHAMLALGYELDKFADMEPSGYTFTFTQELRCSPDRVQALHGRLVDRALQAADLVQEAHDDYGLMAYVETEIYGAEHTADLPERPFDRAKMDRFPFAAGAFSGDGVSPHQQETVGPTALEVRPDERRAADVHVKVPGRFEEWRAGVEQDVRAPHPEPELKASLERCGFYQVTSESGNYIYNAHFDTVEDANLVFDLVRAFAADAGGITMVARELCSGMWRTHDIGAEGAITYSEVPPLHKVRPDAVRAAV